jgi:DNA-binding response OmpR family regulator
VAKRRGEVQLLAVVAPEKHAEMRRQLAPLKVNLVFVSGSGELAHEIGQGDAFQVVILPASLPDIEWWALWGGLALLSPRPAILVYAPRATFQLWSGVLELGGYDVIVEPLSDEELQKAVLRAAKSFEERLSHGAP